MCASCFLLYFIELHVIQWTYNNSNSVSSKIWFIRIPDIMSAVLEALVQQISKQTNNYLIYRSSRHRYLALYKRDINFDLHIFFFFISSYTVTSLSIMLKIIDPTISSNCTHKYIHFWWVHKVGKKINYSWSLNEKFIQNITSDTKHVLTDTWKQSCRKH